jgi:hypothetical protein
MEKMIGRAGTKSAYWSDRAQALLTPLTTLFAHYQGSPAKKVVIKTSTGAVAALRSLRKAWPMVPCVVMIRNPLEVLVSNLQKPPEWLVAVYANNRGNGLFEGLFGVPPVEALNGGVANICAWVIGRYCATALDALDDRCRVLDYEDLGPEAAISVAEFFGVRFSAEELQELGESFQVNAKYPTQTFEPDSEAKLQKATESVARAARLWIGSAYDDLHSIAGWR